MNEQTKDFLNTLSGILLRCWVFGFALLLFWFFILQGMRTFVHYLHGSLFGVSDHELDVIFYCGMGLVKIGVLTFFFIPWLSIKLMLRKSL